MHTITVCTKCNNDFMYHSTDWHLEREPETNKIILAEYPIKDDQWPSRRWNEDRTDYADLSGCYVICQECDEKERREATDVNFNGERLCNSRGCPNNANECGKYCNDCYDEKYPNYDEGNYIE